MKNARTVNRMMRNYCQLGWYQNRYREAIRKAYYTTKQLLGMMKQKEVL